MNGDAMGGGVVIAIAAGLWLVYLLPTWMHRREFLATERNAVRLQQTLRILAATSELPEEVRLEANARTVAQQQRALHEIEEKAAAEARREAAREAHERALMDAHERATAAARERALAAAIARAEAAELASAEPAELVPAIAPGTLEEDAVQEPLVTVRRPRRNVRRARRLASLMLLVSLIAIGFGVADLLATSSWVLVSCATAACVGSFLVLGRLARVGRARPAMRAVVAAPAASELYDHGMVEEVEVERQTWTPQPLPKPLHLSKGTIAAAAMASQQEAAELRRAAARFELEERAARLRAPELPRVQPAAAYVGHQAGPRRDRPVQAPERPVASRFARMGVVDESGLDSIDLDAAFRRRRAAS